MGHAPAHAEGQTMRIGTPKEVATLLGVHINTVYALAQKGEIPTLRRIGPRLRFDLDQIESWMRGQS
jgi:excisionase family DNA binding protein